MTDINGLLRAKVLLRLAAQIVAHAEMELRKAGLASQGGLLADTRADLAEIAMEVQGEIDG